MSVIERVLDRLFEFEEIRDGCEAAHSDRPVYLKRWFIVRNQSTELAISERRSLTWRRNGNGVQVYIHNIRRSDADRELHDHPWNFLSLILLRGYVEETTGTCDCSPCLPILHDHKRKRAGMLLWRRAEHRHRVVLAGRPAWTLVFTSGKQREWGFWRRGSFIHWRGFVARKCEETR